MQKRASNRFRTILAQVHDSVHVAVLCRREAALDTSGGGDSINECARSAYRRSQRPSFLRYRAQMPRMVHRKLQLVQQIAAFR